MEPNPVYNPFARPFVLADCVELAYADACAAAACGDPTPLPDPPAPFPRSVETQLLTGLLHLTALERLPLARIVAWADAEDLSEAVVLMQRHYPRRPPQVLRWIGANHHRGMFQELRAALDCLTAEAR